MKIISKNMIVTTIPSGGANVNLFFALFPRADKMLIGSIIASGFRDKKHSRNDAEDILRIAHLKIAYLGWAILIFTYHLPSLINIGRLGDIVNTRQQVLQLL